MTASTIERLAALPDQERAAWLAGLSAAAAEELLDEWDYWARPSQRIPTGNWAIWLALAGRGWGKTRVGSEYIKRRWRAKIARRIALVGPTQQDTRDVMVEGESGLVNIHWKDAERPRFEPSKARVVWPDGAIAKMYSAEIPARLRGPQHDTFWADELGAWRYADAWDQLMFGLRLGSAPQGIVTTTPKPVPMVTELVRGAVKVAAMEPSATYDVVMTTGSTYENASNIAPKFLERIRTRYEGTRLGRQEIDAELLTDVPGALWTTAMIEEQRIRDMAGVPKLTRVVVAVDPGGSSGPDAEEAGAETGIVAAGAGVDGHFYVLGDASLTATPNGWARVTNDTYDLYKADRIVAERNFGGEMVESTIRTFNKHLPVTMVNASRGKDVRAEPISALYEQKKVHHIGYFGKMESEMTTWVPALKESLVSPNRMDALVWALTELSTGAEKPDWSKLRTIRR